MSDFSTRLAKAAEQRGWQVVELYSDNGISGAKGREQRPAFDRMCRDAIAGKFDIVAAWSVDRLGRSVLHLAQFVEDLRAAGVGLFLGPREAQNRARTSLRRLDRAASAAANLTRLTLHRQGAAKASRRAPPAAKRRSPRPRSAARR